jgi:hypothetical protein
VHALCRRRPRSRCSSRPPVCAILSALAWTDITSITKQSVLFLLDNAIRIVVIRRSPVRLCHRAPRRLLRAARPALEQSDCAPPQVGCHSTARQSTELVADSDDNADDDRCCNGALTRHALDRARLHDNQRRSLHIPPDEKIVYSFQCQLYVPPPKPGNVLGACLVTSNALCFLSERTREISLVLPFSRITAIAQLRRVLRAYAEHNPEIGYCVPEEHEILTNRGFLDLDAYEAAAAADPTLLVASYNVAAKALVFEKPNKLVLFEAGTRQLVELSNADEMLHVWSADSDSHGLKARRSNGVSMLVTKEHDVFAQLGNASVEKNGSLMPDGSAAAHAKIQAGDLLEPTKTYNTVRQLAVAEAGVQKETVPDVCDELGLRTPQQRALFYEIYGFWLGDGTLKYHGPNAGYVVQFAQVKEADNDWLAASLSELDVQYTKSAASKAGQVQITIQSDAWNRCFAAEYKHAADFVNEGDIDDIDADGVVDDDVDVSPTQSSKRKRADVSSEGADAVDALSNLKKFATFCEATDRHTATALRLQRVRDAVELTNDAIVAPPARAAAVAPVDAEGRAFDTVSTANGSYMQPEGIKSAKWFASWVWRLGAASLRHVLAGLLRADGNVDQRTIYTSSARFRDEIQRVCLMAGYTAFFRCVSKGVDQGRTVIAARQLGGVTLPSPTARPSGEKASKPSLFKARGEIRERQYTGRVWCFNMPSGFIWVRRVAKDEHGVVTKASRPLITGNCRVSVALHVRHARAALSAQAAQASREDRSHAQCDFAGVVHGALHRLRARRGVGARARLPVRRRARRAVPGGARQAGARRAGAARQRRHVGRHAAAARVRDRHRDAADARVRSLRLAAARPHRRSAHRPAAGDGARSRAVGARPRHLSLAQRGARRVWRRGDARRDRGAV